VGLVVAILPIPGKEGSNFRGQLAEIFAISGKETITWVV